MTRSGADGRGEPGSRRVSPAADVHETVGAYALGILDDAEATAFEEHLAGCEWCARQLEELAGMEPVLAALAQRPGPGGTPSAGASLSAGPGPRPVEQLLDEVAARRARRRRRARYLVAAAVALIVGGPLTVYAVQATDRGDSSTVAAETSAQAAFRQMPDKVSATDPATHVTATVALAPRAWGTDAVLRLENVTGPERCTLVAVGRNGERETLTTWSVPDGGYGVPAGSSAGKTEEPLYVHGGAALGPQQIERFEVITADGRTLVQVRA
ncbi:zf-HC2 domain-containing protein [Streptomyces thermodiastaticus]